MLTLLLRWLTSRKQQKDKVIDTMDKKIKAIQKTTKDLEHKESSLLKADKKQDSKMKKCDMMKKKK
jgi:hypothetical protein